MKLQSVLITFAWIIVSHVSFASGASFDFDQKIESMDIRAFDSMRQQPESEPSAPLAFVVSKAPSVPLLDVTGSHEGRYVFSMPLAGPNEALDFKGLILNQKPDVDYKILESR